MSISMTQTAGKQLGPASTITISSFPLTVFGWVYITSAEVTSAQEFIQFWDSVGGSNYLALKTNNSLTTTPASKTMFLCEEKQVGRGVVNVPKYDDAWTLDAWNQFVWYVADTSTTPVLEVNNSVVSTGDTVSFNPFNDSANNLDEIYVLSKQAIGETPHIGDWAGFGFIERALTTTEKSQLQSYWPGDITTLSDGYVWDFEDGTMGLSAVHGSIDLQDLSTGSYTMDGGNNPSISHLAASSGVAGIILGGG